VTKFQKELINNAKKLLQKKGVSIKKKYSVSQLGIGFKTKKGKITNKIAIICYVTQKKTIKEIKKDGIIPLPKEIDGILTDVVEIPEGFKPRMLEN